MNRLAAYGEPVEGTPFGRYRLIEMIGAGGMGEVWRAYDTAANNREVAIKLLPPNLANDSMFVQRFRREADAAAALKNPHIIPIHNYGEIDGRLYVDMRLIEGRDLQEVLADGPLEPGRAVRIIEQVAKALQAAHRIGLVHRDVKPSNILLDEDDFAYLIDFGIARAADQTGLTGTGAIIGGWPYMSPERLRAGQVDARSDIYALACVLYECLTGTPPFPGFSMESQIAAHLMEPPPQPSTAQPSVPARFDSVIARGMAKDPDQRYATTVELATAAHDAITTPPAPPGPTLLSEAPPATPRPAPTLVDEQPPSAPEATLPAAGVGVGGHAAPPGPPMTPHATAPLPTPPGRASAISPRNETAKRVVPQPETENRPRRSRWRMFIIIGLVLLLVPAGLAIGRAVIKSHYYIAEYNGKVSVLQGNQGSLLGISLYQPYLVACVDTRNELSLISYAQSGGRLDCHLVTLQDLRPPGKAQVQSGLPGGTLDQAESQLRKLLADSLLPPCAPLAGAPSAPTTTEPTTVTALPSTPPQPAIDCRTV